MTGMPRKTRVFLFAIATLLLGGLSGCVVWDGDGWGHHHGGHHGGHHHGGHGGGHAGTCR